MGAYDMASKRAIQEEPLAVVARLGELAKVRWRFVDWAPTQTTPEVEGREQTADRAVVLEDLDVAGRLWLALMEFQSRHEPDKLDDLFAEAAQFRRSLRHGPERAEKYAVMPVLVYLTGVCPEEGRALDMRSPGGQGMFHAPVIWEVCEDSASAAMDVYEQGKTTWGILFWVALMKGADEDAVVVRWLSLVEKLPAAGHSRAELKGIALVFAGLAGRGQVWVRALEGWTMTESPIVNAWMEQAANERELMVLRRTSLEVLSKRFPGQVPSDVERLINDQPSREILHDWTVQAALLPSINEVSAYLRR